ncbi:MAG: Major facilitator superfamily MFS_1 [archaeon GW2011_AR17]|nr:MAG: Major facilitator superfamily MFS_1 [archaeon GW2011_AR17]MBS3154231.1 MFS transporter [Candidatus Woesearchaeota archaeon]HIH58853.1 MFS transporter [Nanoarchaeota archaeon]HIJ05291.1 MFS transporter [Nanoarchaeota archaeon]
MEFQKEEFKLLWKVYLAELLRGIGAFIVPFMTIFLQGKSLSLAQIGILLGIVSLTNFFFEIPTGVIADKYGRKFSALLGFTVSYLSFFLMIFTSSYSVLMLLFFFHGVGFTFISGAYDGWIYEYLKSHKKEKYMHNFYSRRLSFSYLGFVVSALLAGYFVSFLDLYWLIVFDTAFGLLFILFLLQVPDPPLLKKKKSMSFKTFFETIKTGFFLIKNNRNLSLLVLASIFFSFTFGANELLYQPAYVELGTPLSYLGYIASIGAVLLFVIPNLLLQSNKKYPRKTMIIFSFLDFILVCSLFFVSNYFLFAFLLILSSLCSSIVLPTSDSLFQHSSKTEVRATAMSIYNMLLSVVFFIVFISFGALADIFGAQVILALSGLFIIPSIICYCLIKE